MGTERPKPSEGGLQRHFDDLIAAYLSDRDLEANVSGVARLARRAKRVGNNTVLTLCLVDLAHLHWRAGRLETALRYYREWPVGTNTGHAQRWLGLVRLYQALGRTKQSLRMAEKGLEWLRRHRSRTAPQWRAELQYEAGLAAHVLGDYGHAVQWLRRATAKLRRPFRLPQRDAALLLLEVCRLGAGRGSAARVRARAERCLHRAKRDPVAAAALALAAWHDGEPTQSAKWQEIALPWATGLVGRPFCHDGWQQAHAVLRQMRDASRRPRPAARPGLRRRA
jgi:tetratricopeptide (TPR) repeat protein